MHFDTFAAAISCQPAVRAVSHVMAVQEARAQSSRQHGRVLRK